MTLGYGLLAFPRDSTGKDCFIINGNGTMFSARL